MPDPRLKVPPLIVVLVMAVSMWLSSRMAPALVFRVPGRSLIALILAVTGTIICALGIAKFRRVRTTINPLTPEAASTLVRSGIYSVTRNPMYLGLLIVLLAWGVYLSNALALIFVPLFVSYMNRFQIHPEETALRSRFGRDFASYASRVRRWL